MMAPRTYTATHHSQTEIVAPVALVTSTPNHHIGNGHILNEKPKETTVIFEKISDIEKSKPEKLRKDESVLFERPKHGYTKFDDSPEKEFLEKSKFGSLRNGLEGGNYVRLSDPLAEPDRLHYERELAKFNERYFRDYLDTVDGGLPVKEEYLPELQTPLFAKVKSGRLRSLYEDISPTYEGKKRSRSPSRHRSVTTPTLDQLEDYLRGSSRSRRADTPGVFPMEPIEEREGGETDGRASGTPTDPGYVQYAAERWPDRRDGRTPRHSPTH